MKKNISIIVPCYGVEKYLNRCLDSLVNQTLKDIEIILVDDESPDNVPMMCDDWASKDSRIKVIHKKNGGLGFARNSGLEIASGEFVAFVDSDDFVDLNMYETLYSKAVAEAADAVFCNMKFFRDGTAKVRYDVTKEVSFWGRDEVDDFLLDYVAPKLNEERDVKYTMSVWHAIYRNRVIKDNHISFVSERQYVSEDCPFNIDFLSKALKVVYVPNSMYYYCFNGASLSSKKSIEKNDKRNQLLLYIEKKLSELFPKERYREHYNRFVLLALRQVLASDLLVCRRDNLNFDRQMKKRCGEECYERALKEVNLFHLPVKKMLFYWVIKKRWSWLFKIVQKFT